MLTGRSHHFKYYGENLLMKASDLFIASLAPRLIHSHNYWFIIADYDKPEEVRFLEGNLANFLECAGNTPIDIIQPVHSRRTFIMLQKAYENTDDN